MTAVCLAIARALFGIAIIIGALALLVRMRGDE